MTHASKIVWCAAACGALLLVVAGKAHGGGLIDVPFDLADFSTPLNIDNPYFPLAPGTHIVYSEVTADECTIDDFTVTGLVKSDFIGDYAGLQARVVSDNAWLDEDCDGGRDVLLESTADWYAQDNAGNVWYVGEDTTEYLYDDDGGPIGSSTEGSWQAGTAGAQAGLIMLASPGPGDFYAQEFAEDVAEDAAKVIGVNRSASIGLGEFGDCVTTKEWSPLETGVVEHKTYCAGIGQVQGETYGHDGRESAEAIAIELP